MSRASSSVSEIGRAPQVERPSDGDLMRSLGQGEISALGVLYDRHHAAVRSFVARSTGGAPDTDDVAQSVFLTTLRAASSYDGRPSARPFLIGVAAQLLRRRERSFARLRHAVASFATTFPERFKRTPEDSAAGSQTFERFERAVASLPLAKRMVFLMVEREGMSGDEVARALEIPVATVWTRLHSARCALRSELRDEVDP